MLQGGLSLPASDIYNGPVMGLSLASKLFLTLVASLLVFAPGRTPEATITEFVDYLNSRNFSKAATLVQGGKPKADYSTISTLFGQFRFTVVSMKSSQKGDKAAVTLTAKLEDGRRGPQTASETVNLVRVNHDWLIVPAPGDEMKNGMIGSAATMTTKDLTAIFADAKQAAKKTVCMSNLKQLATATLIFLADHDDVFKMDPAKTRAALRPYTKNDDLWYCPVKGKTAAAYSLNTKLIGRNANQVKDPAKTVMLYEGSKGKLDFRHYGAAAVAFADGHVKSIKQVDAAKLVWNP